MFFKLKDYNSDYYKIYIKRKASNWDTIPSFAWIKNALSLKPGDLLLDAGSGDGSFLNFLCPIGTAIGYGVDISDTAITLARSSYPRFEFKKGTLTALPFSDQFFDRIVCFNVIEHLIEKDQDQALKEFKRVLKPKGILVIGTNIRDSIAWWLYQRLIGEHTHLREFTVHEFKRFIETQFKIQAIAQSSGVFRPPQPFRWIFHNLLKGDVLIQAKY